MLIIFFLASCAYAEQSGTINITTIEAGTYLTGFSGYTIAYCNGTNDCHDTGNYQCLLDYDLESVTGSVGWCATAGETGCAHNSSSSAYYYVITSGNTTCINTTAYRGCSSGIWSNVTNCTTGQTCQGSACAAPSPSYSYSSSSSSVTNVSKSFIIITIFPTPFDIAQGSNVTKVIGILNGNTTQRNITINITGVNASWYSIIPKKIESLSARNTTAFSVIFEIPEDADISTYNIQVRATTSNVSVGQSVNFTIRVLPSNKTIEEKIKPSLSNYTNKIAELDAIFSTLRQNFTENQQKRIENLIKFAKAQLQEAQDSLDQGNYFQSAEDVKELEGIIRDIEDSFNEKIVQTQDNTFIMVLAVVLVIASAAVIFLLWPRKEAGYSEDIGWVSSKGSSKKILTRIKKIFTKKNKRESYFNEKKNKP
jgi:hypothetical protein